MEKLTSIFFFLIVILVFAISNTYSLSFFNHHSSTNHHYHSPISNQSLQFEVYDLLEEIADSFNFSPSDSRSIAVPCIQPTYSGYHFHDGRNINYNSQRLYISNHVLLI